MGDVMTRDNTPTSVLSVEITSSLLIRCYARQTVKVCLLQKPTLHGLICKTLTDCYYKTELLMQNKHLWHGFVLLCERTACLILWVLSYGFFHKFYFLVNNTKSCLAKFFLEVARLRNIAEFPRTSSISFLLDKFSLLSRALASLTTWPSVVTSG